MDIKINPDSLFCKRFASTLSLEPEESMDTSGNRKKWLICFVLHRVVKWRILNKNNKSAIQPNIIGKFSHLNRSIGSVYLKNEDTVRYNCSVSATMENDTKNSLLKKKDNRV